MSRCFEKGAICVRKPFAERIFYDVSNNRITAQFDGVGGISKYAVMNKSSIFSSYYTLLSVDGNAFDWSGEKEVSMCGRMQKTSFEMPACTVKICQFLDTGSNAIFNEIEVTPKRDLRFDITVNFGTHFSSYLEQLLANRLSLKNIAKIVGGFIKKHPKGIEGENPCYMHGDPFGDLYIDVAANEKITGLEAERNYYNQFTFGGQLKAGESKKFRYVLSAGTRSDFTNCDVREALVNFDARLKEAEAYNGMLLASVPAGIDDEETRSYYTSLLNCSLSNYKELGEFKGFLAGIVYQFPARTYYRDAYWTVLSVLPVQPELVKNEILTLARGVDKKTGNCPSAVKFNFKNHWGDHYDSPSFLALMIHDYIAATGDDTVLDLKVGGRSVLTIAQQVIDHLSERTDATGLLIKGGEFNRRDWCDNVFRHGYVSYDEGLYARALFAMAEFFRLKKDGEKERVYREKFETVKKAINDLLWDEEKGWFVNYTTDGFTEDNLSIDTVVIPLFGLCSEERARRMLSNMEALLESKNNTEQSAGDFGTMSVYPFYKDAAATVQKSSLPYYYHNGGDWPYLSCVYAYAKMIYGMDGTYPLTRWFSYNLDQGRYTPVEFFSPLHPEGSLLQAWSSTGAFTLAYRNENFFKRKIGNEK